MKKRTISAIMAAMLAAGMLAGCGSSQTADTTSADAAATEAAADTAADAADTTAASDGSNVTLRFAWWGGDERNEATQAVIKQYEEAHPGVTIEAEPGSNDGYHDKLATQLASGTAPDIVQIDPETMPTFVDAGDYFVDLNTTSIDMSTFDADYISLRINGNYDGKQLGLPTGIAGPAILVDKTLADKFGVDMTKEDITWEDWLDYADKIHEQDPETYLFCANKEYITNLFVFTLAKQYGGPIFDDNGKLAVTEDTMTKVFAYVKDLFDHNAVAPASYMASYIGDDIQADANWIAGKYVAAPCYISTADVMVAANPNDEYVAGALPVLADAKDGGFASNTPQLLSITNSCKNPDVAADFLNYFFNDKTAQETLGATRSVPPTEQARQICEEDGKVSQIVTDSTSIAMAVGGTPNDKIASSAEAKTILFDTVEAVGYGQMTPEEAAATVIDEFSALQK